MHLNRSAALLGRPRLTAVAWLVPMLALAACASSPGAEPERAVVTESPTFSGADLCAKLRSSPTIDNDTVLTVAGTKQTTMAELRAWVASRYGPAGPRDDLSRYRDLDVTASDDSPVEVCVFRSAKDWPIPHPPDVTTRFNGLRVFAQAADRFAVDAYGEVTRMVSDLSALHP